MKNKYISTIKINKPEARIIFNKLATGWRIIAPVEKPGRGRFSDTPLVDYDFVGSFDDIVFDRMTFYSAKAAVFPIRETLFKIYEGCIKEVECDITPTVIFLRACDIHAMQVMDLHFLKDGICSDKYYERLRQRLKIFLIECCESFENCYCVSLGTNKSDDYAVFMRKVRDGYEIIVKDNEMAEFFPRGGDVVPGPRAVEKNRRSINIPEQIPNAIFNEELWKEYSQRCIACGRCNTSCPTCTCFTMLDIPGSDPAVSERSRIWSSCHVDKFSLLAGGHDFRKENADRMRYRTLHKIRDFKRRNGRHMCIGCGRCDDVCPEYISMFYCISKINQALKDGNHGR